MKERQAKFEGPRIGLGYLQRVLGAANAPLRAVRSSLSAGTSLRIVTCHAEMVDAEAPVHPNANLNDNEYIDMISWLHQSACLFHRDVSLTVLTSPRTSLRGLKVPYQRFDGPFSPASVMYDRARAQLAFIEQYDFSAPMLLLDSDILINANLIELLSRDFDIALTWRRSAVMPLNGGVLILSCRRPEVVRSFFRRYLAIYRQDYTDQMQWFGDQMALRDAVGLTFQEIVEFSDTIVTTAEGASCLLLPVETYNHSPDNRLSEIVEPIRDASVLHFKGERKRLMEPYWHAHLEGLRTPLPFNIRLPWRVRAANAALLALQEAATSEELASASRT